MQILFKLPYIWHLESAISYIVEAIIIYIQTIGFIRYIFSINMWAHIEMTTLWLGCDKLVDNLVNGKFIKLSVGCHKLVTR